MHKKNNVEIQMSDSGRYREVSVTEQLLHVLSCMNILLHEGDDSYFDYTFS